MINVKSAARPVAVVIMTFVKNIVDASVPMRTGSEPLDTLDVIMLIFK